MMMRWMKLKVADIYGEDSNISSSFNSKEMSDDVKYRFEQGLLESGYHYEENLRETMETDSLKLKSTKDRNIYYSKSNDI